MAAGRSDAYWARRAEGRRLDLLRDAERAADEIGRAYLEACRQLQDEADKIFRAFRRNGLLSEVAARRLLNQYPDASARELIKRALATMPDGPEKQAVLAQVNAPAYQYRIGRLEQLRRTIGERLGVVAQQELEVSTRSYVSTLQEAYYRHLYDVQRGAGLGFQVADFSPRRLREALAQAWSGRHYSARIWRNAEDLAQRLRGDLLAAALTGRSERDIAKQIEVDYQAGAYASRRLVRTESAYLAGQADQLAYEELMIDRYRYLATLDMRTSSLCQGLDGRQFARSQAKVGVNYPPMHPNCRSTTVAVIDDEALEGMTRRARDPDTGEVYEVPADMTYRQWMAARKLKKTGFSGLTTGANHGILQSSETTIQLIRGVGAKGVQYRVRLPNGEWTRTVEGSRITRVKTIAGRGRERQIDELPILLEKYGGKPELWEKKKGLGWVEYEDEEYQAELHWYEEPSAGRVEFKLKTRDGGWFLDV